jgi:hypothetical protein
MGCGSRVSVCGGGVTQEVGSGAGGGGSCEAAERSCSKADCGRRILSPVRVGGAGVGGRKRREDHGSAGGSGGAGEDIAVMVSDGVFE